MLVSARQTGFTLIEVMVAFLVLSIGLMGSAYMQTRSVQFGNESQNRSQINMLVGDMIDRMRSNMVPASSANSTVYTNAISATDLDTSECNETTELGRTTVSGRNDTVCFYRELETIIPISNMTINTVDLDLDTNQDNYQITVFWSDQQLSQGNLDVDSDEGTTAQVDCIGTNRTWSGDLLWPDPNRPSPGVCMVNHTWVFEVPIR